MPVLVDGATFPTALPADIEAIAQHHAVTLTHDELETRCSWLSGAPRRHLGREEPFRPQRRNPVR